MAGWQPREATDFELQFFGLPIRPKDDESTKAWLTEWGVDTSVLPLIPCEPIKNMSADTANWSGVTTAEQPVTQVYASTPFKSGSLCAAQPDSFSNWVGLGGVNGTGLIQNGFVSAHGSGSYAFYEFVGDQGDTHIRPVDFPGYQQADQSQLLGDQFNFAVTWDGSNQGVTFSWHDLNKNFVSTTGLITQVTIGSSRYDAVNWYDPRQGVAVVERIGINGSYSHLRNFGTLPWTNTKFSKNNGPLTPIRQGNHKGFSMSFNGTMYATSGAADPNLSNFTNVWGSC